jgi:hypothetical protein
MAVVGAQLAQLVLLVVAISLPTPVTSAAVCARASAG